jgi:geranylgeranyl diphosphate synthase type I
MAGAKRNVAWLGEMRSLLEARLGGFFEDKRRRGGELAPEALELVEAVERLTMRGGKRFRPALMTAAFRAVAPERDWTETLDAGAALELLQSYLLIHDDWMDGDEERRGGPAVHAALRDAHGGDAHLGGSLAILAGNLASAHAWELLTRDLIPEPRRTHAIQVFLRMHQEVVFGQQLDLLGSRNVSLMQQLKTGSYTVRGPLALGAALADATDAQRRALEAFGEPLGEAFQMRDDLLGTFGDAAQIGKPVGSDLRAGKRTALIDALDEAAHPDAAQAVHAVLGRADATDEGVERARAALVEGGARARVEARLDGLLRRATDALDDAPLHPPGTEMLRELADRLAVRDR